MLVVIAILSLDGIDRSLNDTVRHADTQYGECIPQAAHEDNMGHIPNPFEIKWKHYLFSSSIMLQPVSIPVPNQSKAQPLPLPVPRQTATVPPDLTLLHGEILANNDVKMQSI